MIAHARIEEKFNFIIVTRFFIQSDCEFEFSIYGCSFTVDSLISHVFLFNVGRSK